MEITGINALLAIARGAFLCMQEGAHARLTPMFVGSGCCWC